MLFSIFLCWLHIYICIRGKKILNVCGKFNTLYEISVMLLLYFFYQVAIFIVKELSCSVLSRNAPAHGRDVTVITRGIARISIIIVKSLTKKRGSNGLHPGTDVIGIRTGQSRLLILFVRFKTSQFVVGIFCQCYYTVSIEFMFHRCQSSCVIEVHYTAKIRGSGIAFQLGCQGACQKGFGNCITGVVTCFGIVFEVCIRKSRYTISAH